MFYECYKKTVQCQFIRSSIMVNKKIPKIKIPVKSSKSKSKTKKFVKALLTYGGAIIIALSSMKVWSNYKSKDSSSKLVQNQFGQCPETPRYWGVWDLNQNGNLQTLNRIFELLGYVSVNASAVDSWDVLWSVDDPYVPERSKIFDSVYKPLKEHQRVNHFPGFNSITSKLEMATQNRDIKSVLPGFRFPAMTNEFKSYVTANPNARFVEKSIENRGMKLVDIHEIQYDKSNKFYQHFMEKPFLVDDRSMNFEVYVLVSSIDPLRIYRYSHEVHVRLSPEPYYPFDPKNPNKFANSDNHQDFLQLPGTKEYFDKYGYSFKLVIEDYFQEKGHNVTELWKKIDEAITQLLLHNEDNLVSKVCIIFLL